jgi:hypothetical protein
MRFVLPEVLDIASPSCIECLQAHGLWPRISRAR